ncbi:MAG: hypothetical protein ACMUIG_04795 [Thermoplasmatota archaeon]
MALGPLPKDQPGIKPTVKGAGRMKKSRFVTWFAITMGVSMVGIGILMTLWGFAWQSNIGESDPLDASNRVGGPILIPMGLLFIGLGVMWVWNGYHGFPRRGEMEAMKKCPACHRNIEADLDFCYHCNTRIPDEKGVEKEGEKGVKKKRKAADLDQL